MVEFPCGPSVPRIACVCPFDLSRVTGSPIRARLTIEGISKFAYCHAISLGDFSFGSHHQIEGVWVPRRGGGHRFRIVVFTRQTARALAIFAPDIVHCFNTISMLPAILYRRRKRQAKLVLELHGLLAEESQSRWPGGSIFHRAIDRIAVRSADPIIAMSHTQRRIVLQRYGVAPESVAVIWSVVDLDIFAHREPPEQNVFQVGYAGNDGPWQGVEDLLMAAATFKGDPQVRFRVIGIRKDRFNLPEGASVEIFPRMPQEEAARLLTDCDVLVSPRRGRVTEAQYPHKLSAYLALGRPIIATDVSDQRAILEAAGCGMLVPPGSPEAIAAAIRQVRDMTHTQRVEMGRRARQFAEQHLSIPRFQAALAQIYDSLESQQAVP